MALTMYASLNATSGGPVETADFSDLSTLAPGAYVYAFLSGTQNAKFFFSSAGGSVALPQTMDLTTVAVPYGYTVLAGGAVAQAQYTDVAGNLKKGGFWTMLKPAAGSPDAGSPTEFYFDSYVVLITTSLTSEWA